MNRDDEISRMAQEVGFERHQAFGGLIVRHSNGSWIDIEDELEAFFDLAYAAGAEKEREECAKVCDAAQIFGNIDERWAAKCCSEAIRARKQT